MNLKKAMKKYPIKKICDPTDHYDLGDKQLWQSFGIWNGGTNGWENTFNTESEAVSWLIAGAKKLSPMERACKKWPIKAIGTDNPVYQLGERSVFLSEGLNPGKWMKATKGGETFTESEAVAYLLEGYKKPEPKPFSMLSYLNNVGRIPSNAIEWHKCPVCGKWHI